MRALRHPEIESTPLYEDEVVLATHPAHAFAGDHAVRVEQLGDQELILFDPSSSYHELTSAMFRAAGVSPRGVMVLDSIDAAKRMVQLGLGIALLPRSALSDELDDGSLAAVDGGLDGARPPPDRRDPPPRRGRPRPRAGGPRALRPGRRRGLVHAAIPWQVSARATMGSDPDSCGLVLAEDVAHRAADLAERGARAHGRR